MLLSETDGTSVICVCDLVSEGRARSAARIRLVIAIRIVISHRMASLAGFDKRTVDLDCDARLEQIDRDDEASFARLVPDEHPFESGERALDDANAVALLEVRV